MTQLVSKFRMLFGNQKETLTAKLIASIVQNSWIQLNIDLPDDYINVFQDTILTTLLNEYRNVWDINYTIKLIDNNILIFENRLPSTVNISWEISSNISVNDAKSNLHEQDFFKKNIEFIIFNFHIKIELTVHFSYT